MFIGNGSPGLARRFRDREVPGFTVLTDPSLNSYRALGLKRGVLATLGPASVLAGVRASLRGLRQTSLQGDAWQQGGLLLLMPDGQVPFIQRNENAGDRPELDAALVALAAQRRTQLAG